MSQKEEESVKWAKEFKFPTKSNQQTKPTTTTRYKKK